MNRILLAFLFLSVSLFVHADFSYSYFQITQTSIDYDNLGDVTSIDLEISTELNENIILSWGYEDGDFDDIDIDIFLFHLGIGYHVPISGGADLVSRIEYANGDTDGLLNIDIDGYEISVGIRAKLAEKIEVLFGVIHSDWDIEFDGDDESKSDTDFGANIALDLTDSLQAVLDVDRDYHSLGLRMHF